MKLSMLGNRTMMKSANSIALLRQAPLNPCEPTGAGHARFALATALATVLAGGLLAGCTAGGPHPERMVASAEAALKDGHSDKAVALAEQAVMADPRNAGYRMLLGNAYLRSGRFESAAQAYTDALDLGEDGGKSALSLSLANIAQGKNAEAIDTLNAYRDALPASDYGLALALAGQPGQAATLLADALRAGENSAKMRQNLAYAYALDGGWRESRVMASQDVPAGELDARLQQWAAMNKPEDGRKGVASLLGVPLRADEGQPAALALANFPAAAQLAAEAGAKAEATDLAKAAIAELPAAPVPAQAQPTVADASSMPVPAQIAAIEVPASAPAAALEAQAAAAPQAYSMAVVQPVPSAPAASQPVARGNSETVKTAAVTVPASVSAERGTHVAQLGSFSNEAGAKRAWQHFATRNPALNTYHSQIIEATVRGHRFWRVQAAGFDGFTPAKTVCQAVKAQGGVCLVMATMRLPAPKGRPAETRMARR
jgi:Flp pilus assembly protein TadD